MGLNIKYKRNTIALYFETIGENDDVVGSPSSLWLGHVWTKTSLYQGSVFCLTVDNKSIKNPSFYISYIDY